MCVLFDSELIDAVDVSLDRSGDDVGVGTEAVVYLPVVFHLHVHLAHVVGSFGNGLNGKLL